MLLRKQKMAEKIQSFSEKTQKSYSIFQILAEEGELMTYNNLLNLDNIINMRKAQDFIKENLISKDGDLFLTVDGLITLNNMITDSNNLNLRTCEVKPAGYDKYYMHSTHIENALYSLVDRFNERKITARQFCYEFLNDIHPFKDGNGRTCKILFEDKITNINEIYIKKRCLLDFYFFPNTINTH